MDDSNVFQIIRGRVRGQSNGNILACLLMKGANACVQDLEFHDPDSIALWKSLAQDCTPSDLEFNINCQSHSQSQSREAQHQENINYLELYPSPRPVVTMTPSMSTAPRRESSQLACQPTSANMTQEAPLTCARCNKPFPRPNSLKRHMREKHRDGTKSTSIVEYPCPHGDCNRSKKGSGFGRKERLQRHLRSYCKSVHTQQGRASSHQPGSEFGSVTPADDLCTSVDHEPPALTEDTDEQPRETITAFRSGKDKMGCDASLHEGLLADLKRRAAEERLAIDAEKEKIRRREDQLRRLEAMISESEEK